MNFFKVKIRSKYTPKRTKLHHFKKNSRWRACPRTPLANRMASTCKSEKINSTPLQRTHWPI